MVVGVIGAMSLAALGIYVAYVFRVRSQALRA